MEIRKGETLRRNQHGEIILYDQREQNKQYRTPFI